MRVRRIAVAFLLVTASLTAQPAQAAPAVDATSSAGPAAAAARPAAQPIGTPVRSMTYDGGLLSGTWRTNITAESFSSAAIGNVTGHTDGDTDVVAGYLDGTIHVWSARTGRQEYVVQTGGPIRASISLINVTAGAPLQVLTANNEGHVWLYDFHGGVHAVFHKQVGQAGGQKGFFGTPTEAHLDRNGIPYIIATNFDQHVYVWDLQGRDKPGFPYWAQDTIWSSPVVAYVDGDPFPEIFTGIDCGWGGSDCYKKFGHTGGAVIALQHTGKMAPGFPIPMPGQVVWSTPAVAPLLNNGGKQVIYGSGLFYPNAGREVRIYDSHGHAIKSVPMFGRTFSSPAIGQIYPSGQNQIVIGGDDGYTDIIDTNWHRLAHICTAPTTKGCAGSHSSPIIGDLNGDGYQEVITVGSNTWHVIDHTLQSVINVQIKETAFGLAASPTLVNLDGKATLFFTLIGAGSGGNHAEVVRYTFPTAAGWSAWPMFKADPFRDGNPLPGPPVPAG